MINKVVLVGRTTKDPELKYTQSQIPFVRFTVAVNRTFTNAQGEREADFVSCIVWRKQAENVARFVKKGSLIGVEGRIQTGSYDDVDGKRVYTTDVVCDSVQFLESRNSEQSGQNEYSSGYEQPFYDDRPQQKNTQNSPQKPSARTMDVSEDDLPF
jgi:single-strand DNA-binding protein